MNLTVDRNDLLASVSLGELFVELVGPSRHKTWRCPDPAHAQSGATPPVSLNLTKSVWYCHSCGAGGSAIDAVMLAKGLSVADTFAWLRQWTGLHRSGPARPPVAPRKPLIDPDPPANGGDLLAAFCLRRGWRVDVAERCGLHVVSHSGRPMIRIPYRRNGQVDWYQDREMGPRKPKIHSPTGRPQTMWALDLARAVVTAEAEQMAVVLEGPTDGIALTHTADLDGYPAVFALPGAGSSKALIGRLDDVLAGLVVAVLVDEDDAGERFRSTLHDGLSQAGLVVDVRVPPGAGDVDGWRRLLDLDDDALARAIDVQIAASMEGQAAG